MGKCRAGPPRFGGPQCFLGGGCVVMFSHRSRPGGARRRLARPAGRRSSCSDTRAPTQTWGQGAPECPKTLPELPRLAEMRARVLPARGGFDEAGSAGSGLSSMPAPGPERSIDSMARWLPSGASQASRDRPPAVIPPTRRPSRLPGADSSSKAVADPGFGQQVPRHRGVDLDLLPQVGHVHPHVVRILGVTGPPHGLEQLLVRDDPVRL